MNRYIAFVCVLGFFVGMAGLASSTSYYSSLKLIQIKSEPTPLQTGEYADIWFKLRNNGTINAENVALEFEPKYPFTATPDSKTSWKFGTILPGEEYYFHIRVRVDENAREGTEYLRFIVSSKDSPNITYREAMEIRNYEPALIIEDVEYSPEVVKPGETINITFTLKNLAYSYLKAIDFTLNLNNVPFAPLDSTSRVRIQKIEAEGTEKISFKLIALESADSSAYKIPITITYSDQSGTSFTKSETVGVIVGGAPTLEMGLLSSSVIKSGSKGELTIYIANKGITPTKYLVAELGGGKGYYIMPPSRVYVGNMNADDYETVEYNIYVNTTEDHIKLPVRLEYEDSEGKTYTMESEITVRVYTQEEAFALGLEQKSNTSTIILGIVILIILYIVYRKVKPFLNRKKK